MNGRKTRDKLLAINPNYYKDIRKKRVNYEVATFKDPKKAKAAADKRWKKEKENVPNILQNK